ncbi:hypothetical protein Asppvi_001800 [Aspergillus pseudoviridinutans]|uniref:Uncharacterized protein n=1 Tax=Aspergillus pseudoviridinutans TaxID=1517512 RepID=A0A9P3BJK8_9EURO|nr:uncharacterized protein Asppvi_001800 [Aspergillus pseudoviridinutans]GIJ92522.1 hypothetical protein Asppvi_001800 [Aspergillus pseudoviridinutans]
MPGTGSILITLVGITTSVGCYIADWNETHIYNPRWPPHAKFHNGQTMSLGMVLGLTTLYYLYRPATSAELKCHYLQTSVWIGSLYWITQLSAFFYPGSLAVDPEFGQGGPQVYICAAMFAMLCTGYWMENKKLRSPNSSSEYARKKN